MRHLAWLACCLVVVACSTSNGTPKDLGRTDRGMADSGTADRGTDRSKPDGPTYSAVIVVLGSSTALGVGAKDKANTWANRYSAYLAANFPKYGVVNLGFAGGTTYTFQPSDFTPPAGRGLPEPKNNITAALALKPAAIIIYNGSNDASLDIPLDEQMPNFDRVVALAKKSNVPVWVTTPSGRNFPSAGQLALLVGAKDKILSTYGANALDFWTDIAKADGTKNPTYDAGDGIHVNDAGQAILFERVKAAQLPQKLGL